MFHGSWLIGTFAAKGVRRILTDGRKIDLVMGSRCGKVKNMADSSFSVKIGQNADFEEGSMKEVKLLDNHSALVVKRNGNITAVSNKCTVSTPISYSKYL